MNYEILESHLIFENDKLIEVAVLWKDNSFVRATYSTLNPRSGYQNLTTKDSISPELFQKVAGGGSYLDQERKNKYFPGDRKWSK
jgi:hypothetical protein